MGFEIEYMIVPEGSAKYSRALLSEAADSSRSHLGVFSIRKRLSPGRAEGGRVINDHKDGNSKYTWISAYHPLHGPLSKEDFAPALTDKSELLTISESQCKSGYRHRLRNSPAIPSFVTAHNSE